MKNCTIAAVSRTSAVLPMCCHGTEYSTRSTWAWISGPIFARAQVASTNGPAGSGRSACFSAASNTAAGAAPSSGRHGRRPATSADQRSASACICASEVNSRPRQNESRTYGIGRSTLALSRGLTALAGSTRQP
jgi:hypothetical protein